VSSNEITENNNVNEDGVIHRVEQSLRDQEVEARTNSNVTRPIHEIDLYRSGEQKLFSNFCSSLPPLQLVDVVKCPQQQDIGSAVDLVMWRDTSPGPSGERRGGLVFSSGPIR
jgi:hypothetical protein